MNTDFLLSLFSFLVGVFSPSKVNICLIFILRKSYNSRGKNAITIFSEETCGRQKRGNNSTYKLSQMPKISILTVTSDRKNSLQKFLDSIVGAAKFEETEVLILINGRDKETKELLTQQFLQYDNIYVLKCQKKSRGESRNKLIQQAKGDILYFLDDDIIVKKNTFSILLERFARYKDIDICGGPNLTPLCSSLSQKYQGYLLGSFFGTLWMSQRYQNSGSDRVANKYALILCNLAIKKRVFEKNGLLFNPRIICAEENLLLDNLIRLGYKAMFIPELIVYHERRKNYWDFCRQIFTYGRGRGQMTRHLPHSCPALLITPTLFALYLLMFLFIRNPLYYAPLFGYLLLNLFSCVIIAVQGKSAASVPPLFILFPLSHISYGVGFLYGFFEKGMPQR